MEGNAPFLQTIKEATAVLALKAEKVKKENTIRANQAMMLHLFQKAEGNDDICFYQHFILVMFTYACSHLITLHPTVNNIPAH